MNIEIFEKPLPIITDLLKLTFYISTTVGFLITLIYCASIDYYPTGITIGDTIFFISATLGFSVLYILITYALHCAGVLISPALRLLQKTVITGRNYFAKQSHENTPIEFRKLRLDDSQTIIIGIIVLILLAILYFKNADKALGLTLTIIAMGFLFGLWNTKTKMELQDPPKTSQKRVFILISALIAPLLFSQSNKDMITQSMTMIGVRHGNVTISLSNTYEEFLRNNGIYGTHGVYEGVEILFRGIGNNVVLKIEDLKISVPSEEIIIGIRDPNKA